MAEALTTILSFLGEIGLRASEGPVPPGSFLPGIRIAHGTLVFDRAALRWPGDLLHEAGHIAVTPASLRPTLDDALDPSHSAPHGGEVEAMAWAYAASVHLELDPKVLFHEGGYHGHSEGLILTYGQGVYPGASGLAEAGMTFAPEDARHAGVAPYPRMARWLRE
jgi:hypothetical protein